MLLLVGHCHVCVLVYAIIYTVAVLVSHAVVVVAAILLFMLTLITYACLINSEFVDGKNCKLAITVCMCTKKISHSLQLKTHSQCLLSGLTISNRCCSIAGCV